jgi:phospholipid/cholesterol/gamma-HCH transport system substrate-binding protein
LGDSEELLEIGDTLASGYAVGMINKIEDQLSPLSHKVEKLITNFNVTLKSIENASNGVNTLLSENQQSIRESIDNFNNLSLSLKETAQKTNTVLETFNDKMDSLQMMEIAQLVKDFDKLATDISATVEGLNRGEGSLGKLMTDEQLYTNLTRSSKELEDLLRDLKENPKRYVHFSVFGKKDK